jgi:hypothetical protein
MPEASEASKTTEPEFSSSVANFPFSIKIYEEPDLIWADVQGAEGDLVDGGAETLAQTRFFYTEFSDREWYEGQVSFADLAANLPSFEVVEKFEMDALFRNTNIVMPT